MWSEKVDAANITGFFYARNIARNAQKKFFRELQL
jgi:hypothetical protein